MFVSTQKKSSEVFGIWLPSCHLMPFLCKSYNKQSLKFTAYVLQKSYTYIEGTLFNHFRQKRFRMGHHPKQISELICPRAATKSLAGPRWSATSAVYGATDFIGNPAASSPFNFPDRRDVGATSGRRRGRRRGDWWIRLEQVALPILSGLCAAQKWRNLDYSIGQPRILRLSLSNLSFLFSFRFQLTFKMDLCSDGNTCCLGTTICSTKLVQFSCFPGIATPTKSKKRRAPRLLVFHGFRCSTQQNLSNFELEAWIVAPIFKM